METYETWAHSGTGSIPSDLVSCKQQYWYVKQLPPRKCVRYVSHHFSGSSASTHHRNVQKKWKIHGSKCLGDLCSKPTKLSMIITMVAQSLSNRPSPLKTAIEPLTSTTKDKRFGMDCIKFRSSRCPRRLKTFFSPIAKSTILLSSNLRDADETWSKSLGSTM